MSRFPFGPYPKGWYCIELSPNLAPGKVKALRFFGQELVLFRTLGGAAHLLDAYCPHLGAHLGVAGRVVGETLECGFHGWCLNGEGRCVQIPHSDRKPTGALIRSWPVVEVNGAIMTFYDSKGTPPDWTFPSFPEVDADEWMPFRQAHHRRIRTHVQEMGENGMDNAHLPYLHGQKALQLSTVGIEAEGPVFTHHTYQKYDVGPFAKWFPDVGGPLDICCYGLGCLASRGLLDARFRLEYMFVIYSTPVDEETIELRAMLSVKKLSNPLLSRMVMAKVMKEGRRTIEQDVPVWETKRYRDTPMLSEVDGPIMHYRRWARQFLDMDQPWSSRTNA